MKLVRLKKRKHYPSFPLSRCEAMGEGGRRPGEGSFFDREKHFKSISFADKEPSPALSGTLSHPLDGRGGIDLRRSAKRTRPGGHLINGKIVSADFLTSIE